MTTLQIAQVNIARMRGALEDPVMAGFVARLAEINALADGSPGFVWRLQTPEGNATYLRPYDDDRILFNLSVWKTVEDLRSYVYRTAHAEVLRHGTIGSKSSGRRWSLSGGFPRATGLRSTPRSGSRISRRRVRRPLHSRFEIISSRTRITFDRSTGRRSNRVPPPDQHKDPVPRASESPAQRRGGGLPTT